MASTCIRSMNRTAVSSLKSFITKSKVPANRSQSPFFTPSPSLTRRFRFTSRSPVELGCIDVCLFPNLSATGTARLTSPMSFTSRSFSSLLRDNVYQFSQST